MALVQAWQSLPRHLTNEWTLRLVGPWMEEQGGGGQAFLEKVKNVGGQSIEIREPVFAESELIKQYQSARIFVYPSLAKRGETFGLAVLEAMSCGCVPLVSSLSCFGDFIENDKNGYIVAVGQADGVERLSGALAERLNQPSLEEQSIQAMQTSGAYETNEVAKQFLDDFNQLIRR